MFYRLGAWQRVVMVGAAVGLAGCSWAIAVYAQEPADPMCESLFEEYIVVNRKTMSADVMAATQLIASRGRRNGYWRVVLAKLPEMKEYGERNCVRILGKMLELGALRIERLRTLHKGPSAFTPPLFYLELEVVDELLRRAQCAEGRTLNLYVVALARSLDPRPQQFLEQVIANEEEIKTSRRYSVCFHAAVGLAALGKSGGFNWLIAHVEDTETLHSVEYAWPAGVPDHNLGTCCIYALRALSGQKNLESRAEWEGWWAEVDKPFLPEPRMVMFEWLVP